MNNQPPEESLILGRYQQQKRTQKTPLYRKYLLKDLFSGEGASLKSQKQTIPKPTILHQAGFLQQMQGYQGFPLMIWSGHINKHQVGLVTEQLGPSLSSLMPDNYQGFSLATVCLVGLQIIKIVQILHDKSAVLCDFAPHNFGIHPQAIDTLVVANLYQCRRYRSAKSLQHYKTKPVDYSSFINHFPSYNRLVSMSPSRRDDIESFLYLLIYLRKGRLPWSNVPLDNPLAAQQALLKIIEPLFDEEDNSIKRQTFKGLPSQFASIFEHIHELEYEQRPNYCFIRRKLHKMLLKLQKTADPQLDWLASMPNLKINPLSSQTMNLSTLHDKNIERDYYRLASQKIQLDKISDINPFQTKAKASNGSANGVPSRKKHKSKRGCELM